MSALTRRTVIHGLAACPFAASLLPAWASEGQLQPIVNYWESLARPGGGYGWPDNPEAALTVTYAAIASYRLLGQEPPGKAELAQFLRRAYPMEPGRRKDRPLHRFDYEQAQSLAWLGEPLDEFRALAVVWVKPSYFTNRYEFHENPVLQQETGAILCRKLLGLPATDAWVKYVTSRRRPNGSFNHTPGDDGVDGHGGNTLWGLLALNALGTPIDRKRETAEWIRSCQLSGGGFTYAPGAPIAGHDHVAYTWAALMALPLVEGTARDAEAARAYLLSLWNADGGFGDRPGRASNPLATAQAMEALTAMGPLARIASTPRRKAVVAASIPSNLKIFTMQIEAPGKGSPRETVAMARALGIHLWGAKNSEPGWLEAVQKIAREEKTPVTFFVANEEYGTYVSVPGLGTYSHLVDITAPAGSDFGASLTDDKHPHQWNDFLSRRIDPLRRAGGSNVWQFNENEELTRVLLDQAVESGTFSAISAFHFGNENFLVTQPFLNRYRDVLPYIGLQDAHSQTWWWMEYLTAFRTLFLATEPTWQGWTTALKRNWIVSVRHDSRSNFKTQVAGGSNAVRKHIMDRAASWRWWGDKPEEMRRPWASLVAVGPNDKFDEIRPESGVNLRVRCWMETKPAGAPKDPVTELQRLEVDGHQVTPTHVAEKADVYDRFHVPADQKGRHTAGATVRMIKTGEVAKLKTEFSI